MGDFPAGLTWGIKYTFFKYVERMPDGQVQVFDGAERLPSGEFFFPASSGGRFDGAVRVLAHHGALNVLIANPRIDGDRLLLDEVDLARIEWDEPGTRSRRVTLTADGSKFFNSAYPEGDVIDGLRIER